MPINAVTIDKVLTGSALNSKLAHNLMSCTVEFLKEFGLLVKADHLEVEEVKDYAQRIGCDYLQGYFFSNPLNANELTEFLRKEVSVNGI